MSNIISPYIPAFIKSFLEGTKPVQFNFSEIENTNISSTSSFIYDPSYSPLKNTQQLNVDWSKFENHTFFSSAEAKVNIAFEQIINKYPFDGSRAEVEAFFENLTGFEKWVFDKFPKYRGQLLFSNQYVGSDGTGTWIKINDEAGSSYPGISKNNSGNSILNPKGRTSFTIEAQIIIPPIVNYNQVIFQKLSGSNCGISLHLPFNSSYDSVDARFVIVNEDKFLSVTAPLKKGNFNHICATLNRDSNLDYLQFYVNENLVSESDKKSIGDMPIDFADAIIGSGTKVTFNNINFLPAETFSGSIDEFRIFHATRSEKQQKLYANKSIYQTPELKLYYRFNEPPPPLAPAGNSYINSIVLDSSGNSLHANISNFHSLLRQNANSDALNPIKYEKLETCAVLFPAHADIISLNESLLETAMEYDRANPNLITKLVPQHYFLEAEEQDGKTIYSDSVTKYGGQGIPGQGKLSSTQIIVSFLYIWAKYFDEIKIFLDSFGTLGYLDYTNTDNSPTNFLNDLMKKYGFNFPPFFNEATVEQYVDAENITDDVSTSVYPLRYVQNEILRKVLINLPDVIKSKGTQHSIKSFLRSVGIDPENSLKIREFGGPTTRQLSFAREKKYDYGTMVSLSTNSLITSSFLSSSRVETGYPLPRGTMVNKQFYSPHGISNNRSDGMLTSGSWTVEAIYKFSPSDLILNPTQSLCRICVSGSANDGIGPSCVTNLIGTFSKTDAKLSLYVRPSYDTNAKTFYLELPLPPEEIFDNSKWNVSFGRERSDAINSVVSSSYFIRAGSQNNGEITWYQSTSSYFLELGLSTPEDNIFERHRSVWNDYGPFIAIGGGQSLNSTSIYSKFLNQDVVGDPILGSGITRKTDFKGKVSNLRFWSKALSEIEWKEHIRNYKSRGVQNPLLNFNYVKNLSGSWERLRMETLVKQETRKSDNNGDIVFTDFSQNNFHAYGKNFSNSTKCVVQEIFDYSYLSPDFDESSTTDKIRIRSYLDLDTVKEKPWSMLAPQYEIPPSEKPNDDVRFSIEFSLVDSLNRDIVTMFSTFEAIESAIGSPELLYSPDYPDLEKLRDVYFNRISEKLNFQSFFHFFRWFDKSLGNFIEQLVPRKTKFKGTNFVVESHMLERHKLEYRSADAYLRPDPQPSDGYSGNL